MRVLVFDYFKLMIFPVFVGYGLALVSSTYNRYLGAEFLWLAVAYIVAASPVALVASKYGGKLSLLWHIVGSYVAVLAAFGVLKISSQTYVDDESSSLSSFLLTAANVTIWYVSVGVVCAVLWQTSRFGLGVVARSAKRGRTGI
jgi:hypothetical protein